MKKLFYLILIVILIAGKSNSTPKVQAGIFNQGSNLIIKAKPNENISTGFMPAAIVTIKYLTSYNINLSVPVSTYGLQFYQTLTNGTYTYKIYQTSSGTQNYNWTANTEYEILSVTVSGGIGTGNFEIANDQFITSNNGIWYIEHNIFGDITNYTTPLYHPSTSGVPLPVNEKKSGIPDNFEITQNYPNPFNPVTCINFQIPSHSKVKIIIYNVLGQEISLLVNDYLEPGYYLKQFDATNISSGTYFYRMIAEDADQKFIKTKKMLIIK